MSVNICRKFVLHNDFIPPTKKVHRWDYLAYGYIDGISVEENVFKNRTWDLDLLWKDSVSAKEELVKLETRQVVYGFRNEGEEESVREEEFWNGRGEQTEYPFVFFVMLQFEDEGRKNMDRLLADKSLVEKQYNKEGRVKGITYLTLESSDLLLVLRSSTYDEGAEIVDNIHRTHAFYSAGDITWDVKYSFTIPGVDKGFLNGSGLKRLENEIVHQAYIYATESYAGSIDALYSKLKSLFGDNFQNWVKGKQSILGYNDEVISFAGISWAAFLELYKNKTGILNHSSPEYQDYVSSITTIIGFRQKKFGGKNPGQKTDADLKVRKDFFRFLWTRLKELEQCDCQREVLKNMLLSLHYLANSLSKFENGQISENLFLPSVFSVYLLIEILLEMLTKENALAGLVCYQDYSRFLTGLNSYAQNPVRSDRQFTQSVEFDVRTYNLPVKLNTFYNAFILYVRDFLNEPLEGVDHCYEFLTCPGVSSNMNVEELFVGQSDDKRLFLVNIPENQAYHLELMMIMLCHEIGHFVGSEIRKRSSRKNCLIKALARMISLYYRSRLPEISAEVYDDFWKEFEERFSKETEEEYGHYYEKEYMKNQYVMNRDGDREKYEQEIDQIIRLGKRFEDHSLIIIEALPDATVRIIREKREDLFENALYRRYMYDYQKYGDKVRAAKRRSKIWEDVYRFSVDIMRVRPGHRGIVNIENMVHILLRVCKEGLSDIIAIMTLELNQEQYAMALIENAREQGEESALISRTVDEALIRASLVTACMVKEGEKLGYGWDAAWDLSDEADDYVAELYGNISRFIDKYMNGTAEPIWKRGSQNEKVCDYLCDHDLLEYILRYLLECRRSCAALVRKKETEQNRIKEIFTMALSGAADSMMLQIQGTIEKYRGRIHKKMKRIVKENGDGQRTVV